MKPARRRQSWRAPWWRRVYWENILLLAIAFGVVAILFIQAYKLREALVP